MANADNMDVTCVNSSSSTLTTARKFWKFCPQYFKISVFATKIRDITF